MGGALSELDVGLFLAAPRHAYGYRVDSWRRRTVEERRAELKATGRLKGKIPILNLQSDRRIVEMHDGNTSALALLVHARERHECVTLSRFMDCFDEVIVLRDRVHPSGEIWHPFVLPEVERAEDLQIAFDEEQNRQVRKAIKLEGEPVYYDDSEFFGGDDACEPLGRIAETYQSSTS